MIKSERFGDERLATRTIAKKCKCTLKIYIRRVCTTLVEPGNAALSQECLHVDKASCERRERERERTIKRKTASDGIRHGSAD